PRLRRGRLGASQLSLVGDLEPVAEPHRSTGLTAAAVAVLVQAVLLGVAGAVTAVVVLGLTLDLVVGILWALIRTVGLDAATPSLFPDLAIDNLDTYLFLLVVAAVLLLL